jgi:hypothetical protein
VQRERGGSAGSPESSSRGGGSPALADLGCPGWILVGAWPGRKPTVCLNRLVVLLGSAGVAAARAMAWAARCSGARRRAL